MPNPTLYEVSAAGCLGKLVAVLGVIFGEIAAYSLQGGAAGTAAGLGEIIRHLNTGCWLLFAAGRRCRGILRPKPAGLDLKQKVRTPRLPLLVTSLFHDTAARRGWRVV